MAADYLVWVQDEDSASLLSWNEGSDEWLTVGDPWTFSFDANRPTPQTDLYLPFDTLGITNPTTQTLDLVALASDEDTLKLWATMPADNNLSSPRAIGAPASSDVEAFTLLNAYHWDSLDSGVCPSAGQFNGADIKAALSTDPAGVAYGLFEQQLIAVHPQLFPTAAPWDDAIDSLCNGIAFNGRAASEPIPLPALCQREASGSSADFVNPSQRLGHLLSTAHAPVADGQALSATLRLVNDGLGAAQNVSVTLVAENLLTLADGSSEQTIGLGSLAAGESVELEIQMLVDASVNPGQSDGWTHLQAIVYDETGDRDHPREVLHLNHELDSSGPDYVEVQSPLALTAGGTQTVWGFVSDQSVVPTITLEIDGSEQACQTGGSAQWRCDFDLGARSEGETIALRVKAVDAHGQESAWFDAPTLTVDTTPPLISASAATSATFDGGLVGPDDDLLSGALFDNRLVSRVEVCENGVCDTASVLLDSATFSQTSFTVNDQATAPLLIGAANACSGGEPLTRSFEVNDSFIVADLDVGLNVAHPFRNDLQAWLQSPDGTRVQLLAQGAPAANLDVLLDDAALRSSHVSADRSGHNSSAPHYDNARQPFGGQLYAFRGEDAQGTWQLELCDQSPALRAAASDPAADDGLYQSGQLNFSAANTPANTAAVWQYKLDLPRNVEGITKTLSIYGYDSLDNRSQAITLSFEIDTRPPQLSVLDVLQTSRRFETFNAAGLVSDAHDVTLRLTILPPNGQLTADRIGRLGNTWTYSNTQKFARAGAYRLWVEARDVVGNVTVAGPYQVTRFGMYDVLLPLVAHSWDEDYIKLYLPLVIRQ
ncbi:MAG: hypothetical protein GY831_16145 [Delftia sp.]|nr:hypothetical protein [Delftia sp.]